MSESTAYDTQPTWGSALEGALCPHCDWRYFVPQGTLPRRCPHCFQEDLIPLGDAIVQLPYHHPPELAAPATVDAGRLAQSVESFADGIPFPPQDLNPEALRARLQRVALPMWLVDGDVTATWQAEVGFDYEVVSHQDRYSDRGGWASRQVQETRVRWEPRAGRLARTYHNVVAPALEEHEAFCRALGDYQIDNALAYRAEAVSNTLIRLPDRAPEAAWPDAVPSFQKIAGEECRRAAGADHIRQYQWAPDYQNLNWTLLLLPLYATYYLDDDNRPQPVLINGQSGKLSGARRASMKRAQRAALIIAAVALVIFVVSLVLGAVGVAAPPLLMVGGIGMALALLVGLGALIPIVQVWQFNRQHALRGPG